MVNKTKFSTIMAVIATITAIASIGSIGGIGLGQQQQTAFAQVIGGNEIDVGGVGDTIRDILEDNEDDEDDNPPPRQLCPPPLIYVPIPGPQRYICVDTTFDVTLLPG